MRRLPAVALMAAAMLAGSLPAQAITSVRLRAASIESEGVTLHQADVRLLIQSARRSTLQVNAARLQLPADYEANTGALRELQFSCADPVVREPLLACPRFVLRLRAERFAALALAGEARYDMNRGTLTARGTGPAIGGADATFQFDYAPQGWQGDLLLPSRPVADWLVLARPWFALPESVTASGQAQIALHAASDAGGTRATAELTLRDGAFQNADYTWLGEKLALQVQTQIDLSAEPLRFEAQVKGTGGQALVGPVLLDFGVNPLELGTRGTFTPQKIDLQDFQLQQQNLARLSGSARLSLEPFTVLAATVQAQDIRFPSAYATYLQQSLATTPFNQLQTHGSASASVRIAGNLPIAISLAVKDLGFSDASRALEVKGVQADLHWALGSTEPAQASFLSWTGSRGWGIEGAASRLDFMAHDRNFQLLRPARLPFFDGALRINTFSVTQAGAPDMAGDFDALIEPISIGPIARALGWPEFGGSLAGRIPGLAYRNGELSLQGDIDAQVFDGHVVARNLRVRDPFGTLPRLHADLAARNLDLDLITRTFQFGSITGRLDIDLTGLETVGLSPVSFDLRVATPAGDRSRHRISQRAVQSLSNIGGGGGGVAAALQSGALKFFDEFGYDRLGLNCRLRNDVCQMSGAGPAGTGFYIVKGAGLPRIDIIGNNPRVAWLAFIAQAATALSNPGQINVR